MRLVVIAPTLRSSASAVASCEVLKSVVRRRGDLRSALQRHPCAHALHRDAVPHGLADHRVLGLRLAGASIRDRGPDLLIDVGAVARHDSSVATGVGVEVLD
ncbi:MAG: hypothetical protein MUC68_10585 [Burkholderiaceae bacterium]|nr:hypothetical protein [Burkholderiaceae bacterium]